MNFQKPWRNLHFSHFWKNQGHSSSALLIALFLGAALVWHGYSFRGLLWSNWAEVNFFFEFLYFNFLLFMCFFCRKICAKRRWNGWKTTTLFWPTFKVRSVKTGWIYYWIWNRLIIYLSRSAPSPSFSSNVVFCCMSKRFAVVRSVCARYWFLPLFIWKFYFLPSY